MVTWAASPYYWVLNAQPHVDEDISASMGAETGKGSGVGAKPLPHDYIDCKEKYQNVTLLLSGSF